MFPVPGFTIIEFFSINHFASDESLCCHSFKFDPSNKTIASDGGCHIFFTSIIAGTGVQTSVSSGLISCE